VVSERKDRGVIGDRLARWVNGKMAEWLARKHLPVGLVTGEGISDGSIERPYLKCECGEVWPCRVIRKLSENR
jgi:hypothetical protein